MPDVFFLKLPTASLSASTAKGIDLQLMDDAGQPIALDTDHLLNGFNTTDTDFKIPLAAAHYRLTEATLQADTANTAVTFITRYLHSIKDRLISVAPMPA